MTHSETMQALERIELHLLRGVEPLAGIHASAPPGALQTEVYRLLDVYLWLTGEVGEIIKREDG